MATKIPNGCKIDQTAKKFMYQHLPLQDPTKCIQIGIFVFENIPSGNPAQHTLELLTGSSDVAKKTHVGLSV
jgi:hypothetical protein